MGPLSSKDDDSDAKDLVSFYRGTGVDFSGRTLNDIMKFDMNKLESDHAFIQTLFPLPEGKIVSPPVNILRPQNGHLHPS